MGYVNKIRWKFKNTKESDRYLMMHDKRFWLFRTKTAISYTTSSKLHIKIYYLKQVVYLLSILNEWYDKNNGILLHSVVWTTMWAYFQFQLWFQIRTRLDKFTGVWKVKIASEWSILCRTQSTQSMLGPLSNEKWNRNMTNQLYVKF